MQKEIILGFDARLVDPNLKKEDLKYRKNIITNELYWDEERRKIFLYKKVPIPFSSDDAVWPSVFDLFEFQSKEKYTNLFELKKFLELNSSKILKPYYIVAIIIEYSTFDNDENHKYNYYYDPSKKKHIRHNYFDQLKYSCTPSKREKNWILLGYDVADDYPGFSALSNFGNDKSLEDKLNHLLNEYHLFDNINDAIDFKSLLNKDEKLQRCHAPFSIYSLWLIK